MVCNGGPRVEGAGGLGRSPAGRTGIAKPLIGVCCGREEMRSNMAPWGIFRIDPDEK